MEGKLLIIDHISMNCEILTDILQDEYKLVIVSEGSEALSQLATNQEEFAAVLLNIKLPEGSGYEILEVMRKNEWMNKLPVLIIMEGSSVEEAGCLDMGVTGFVRLPFDRLLVQKRIRNVVSMFRKREEQERKVLQQTETIRRQYKLLQESAEQVKNSRNNIIDILGTIVEYRNFESGEHIRHVKEFTRILAKWMQHDFWESGLTDSKVEMIVAASALHDIGKIAIPDIILLKPGKLTKEEKEYMRAHTTKGCEMIEKLQDSFGKEYADICYEICRSHHERYDGKGYPDGLSGDDIPISAQLVSLADAYDELVSERVYKGAFTKSRAYQMIIQGDCGVFSPKLMECFRKGRAEFEAVLDEDVNEAEDTSKMLNKGL